VPEQQSAVSVHCPHAGMQLIPEQTNGGVPPSTGLGTQGAVLQQLALLAQAPPASTHWAGEQRGTPTLSWWQVSRFSQLPAQQSHDELHDVVANLQTSPSGLQPIGRRQTPTVDGGVMTHVTGLPDPPGRPVEPQQSPSCVHKSPTTWQPLAGWQTNTPVGPQGAHARLQQGPPHGGTPPSGTVAVVAQRIPSTRPQLAGPPGGVNEQVPRDCPAAMLHWPVQQLVLFAHASPGCPQKEDA
jgi:hypothetical protein